MSIKENEDLQHGVINTCVLAFQTTRSVVQSSSTVRPVLTVSQTQHKISSDTLTWTEYLQFSPDISQKAPYRSLKSSKPDH